ncbi:relaxase MobL [Mycoplasmopsis columboralis]|uniref:Uncharacterized protein n=1 Tax=Mycoplasmopsis columboralis TaxID=171282 RepID=A0A449B5J3_9BACT|nr:relaxase MobL [Mycoplasmopsis columboralis]VEU75846.1 Uncharacterised protein [Mycoplasmopsis columboralis]VEU76225.1 Uncharacterised protein [Mycoplasmopsis columboralis]
MKKLLNEQSNSGLYQIHSSEEVSLVDINETKKVFQKIKSDQFIWDTVLSFTVEYAKKHNLYSPRDYVEYASKNLKWLFEKEKLSFKDLNFYATLHTNSDNPHLHLVFFEKEQKFINTRNGKKTFRQSGRFKKANLIKNLQHLNNLKSPQELEEIFETKKQVWNTKHTLQKTYKQSIVEQNNFKNSNQKITLLQYELSKIKSPRFKTLNEELKQKVLNVVEELIENNDDLSKEFSKITALINETPFNDKEKNNFKEKELSELKTNLANTLIKELTNENKLKLNYSYWRLKEINPHLAINYTPKVNVNSDNESDKDKSIRLPKIIYKALKSYKKAYEVFGTTKNKNL